ncbi:MAG: NADH-quinone oxidoreductase subunit M [Actinomycetes bacterium]
MELTLLLFLPLATGLLGAVLGNRLVKPAAVLGGLGTLGVAVGLALNYDTALGGSQFTVDKLWVKPLGIHWALTIDGLNLALVVLTAFVYASVVVACAVREQENPRLFYFHLGLGASAVLGAFLAQDLILFVLFFDLMLVPFYFLVGQWGTGERVAATTKMVIYTLAGSLLMLAAAVATGALAASHHGRHIDFLISNLQRLPLGKGTQQWIFLCFAAAFLVKMPAVPLHGWLKDAYKSMPLPVLALFSGVLSKVAAYGFLKLALPLFPDAAASFQDLLLAIGVISILYGSALAFTTNDARLVVGYSSIAQLGFILIGIFSLTSDGAQGALLQMVNHGVVTVALVMIVGVLASRAKGSEDLGSMGGIAMGAPVLAVVFLIAAFANLAMPASANFIGEFLILKGVFDSVTVVAVIACLGVAMAAVYMLRAYIRAMHGPDTNGVEQRDLSFREALPILPAIALILALAVSPQPLLKRSEGPATAAVIPAAKAANIDPIQTATTAQAKR